MLTCKYLLFNKNSKVKLRNVDKINADSILPFLPPLYVHKMVIMRGITPIAKK